MKKPRGATKHLQRRQKKNKTGGQTPKKGKKKLMARYRSVSLTEADVY